MRQVYQPKPYEIYTRDLDIAGAIEKSEGRVVINADKAEFADNGVLMVDKDKNLLIKVNDTLHTLAMVDDKIKFKEK